MQASGFHPADPLALSFEPQVLIQLRKFSDRIAAEKARASSSPAPPPPFAGSSSGSSSGGSSKAGGKGLLGQDMSEVLSTGKRSSGLVTEKEPPCHPS